MNYSRYSDETLLGLISENDAQAFKELYERHTQIVHSLVARIVRNRSVADEIVQETFWQAWQKASDFKGRGAAAAWLYRIARNKSIDVVRKQKKAPVFAEGFRDSQGDEQPYPDVPDEGHTFHSSLVEQEVAHHLDREQLLKALSVIPAEQRACLEMAYFEGFSQSQISERLDVPLGTVKTRVRMGLEKLEHSLRSAGYNEENF